MHVFNFPSISQKVGRHLCIIGMSDVVPTLITLVLLQYYQTNCDTKSIRPRVRGVRSSESIRPRVRGVPSQFRVVQPAVMTRDNI